MLFLLLLRLFLSFFLIFAWIDFDNLSLLYFFLFKEFFLLRVVVLILLLVLDLDKVEYCSAYFKNK